MEIENVLGNDSCSTAKYGKLNTYEGTTTFKILDEPYFVSGRGYDDTIALKDIEYNIIEGILYIKGTKIIHYNFNYLLDLITVWGKRSVWKINHKLNNRLVEPFQEKDIIIRKFWFFKKVVKGIDLENENEKDIKVWYLSKEEYPYEVALSNFELKEV